MIKRSRLIILLSCSMVLIINANDDTIPDTNDPLLLRLLQQQCALETATTRQPWRPIQEAAYDTVVQIFSQIAEMDLLQPYKTPAQYGCRGSGFFIDNEGTLVTNAHVVDQAIGIWVQIPSMGKRPLDAYVISICPDRDIALLHLSEKSMALIREVLGEIPFLSLGDSDNVHRADEVLALGYPLGQESLKSTTGVISGREKNLIQMSAPINQGSSGGPLLNVKGEVIGVNTSGITEAQNVGYIIPINDFKTILPDLYKFPLLRKPYLGLLSANATDSLTEYLGNPHPGGCQIIEVIKDSPAYKAEVKQGDMLYEINGYPVDIYGDVQVPWCEDKISVGNFISRLAIGDIVDLVLFRNGEKINISVPLDYAEPLPIRKIYPGYEAIDYEVFGGMVVMQLTMNHIRLFANQAPGLARYTETKNQSKPVLFITHVFPSSQLFKSRTIIPGYTLQEVNNIPVNTLEHFRNALKESIESGYLTLKASDTVAKVSDNIFVVLPFDMVLQEELVLSKAFHYSMSGSIHQLFELANNQ